jgi:hypothetical protein
MSEGEKTMGEMLTNYKQKWREKMNHGKSGTFGMGGILGNGLGALT